MAEPPSDNPTPTPVPDLEPPADEEGGEELAAAQTRLAAPQSNQPTMATVPPLSFLSSLSGLKKADLLRRIQYDQRQRWKRGERFFAEWYREQVPDLRTDTEEFLDLVYHEVLLREELGEKPDFEEYRRRLPEHSDALRRLLDLHRELGEATLLDGEEPDSDLSTTVSSPAQPVKKSPLPFLSPPAAEDEIGRLSNYRVLKKLGQGGMGIVFEAEDVRLKRRVALKVMRPDVAANEEHRARFVREAQAAAAVEHDNICPIHQVGEENGVPFIAMSFLAGELLDARLKREKQLPISEAVRIGCEVAEGLAAAHAAGLIHRDIKPANIWLVQRNEGGRTKSAAEWPDSTFQRAKILDFGLARPTVDDLHLTQSGAILGTPAYMAPEQAQSKPVDQRADLFSLGVVLYEMTTGQRPFTGGDIMSVLRSLAVDEPVAPKILNPAIPAAFSNLVMRLLSKSPDDRPADAGEVADALQAILMTFSHSLLPLAEIPSGNDDLESTPPSMPVAEAAPLPAGALSPGPGPAATNSAQSKAMARGSVSPASRATGAGARTSPSARMWVAVVLSLLFLVGVGLVVYKPAGRSKPGLTTDNHSPDVEPLLESLELLPSPRLFVELAPVMPRLFVELAPAMPREFAEIGPSPRLFKPAPAKGPDQLAAEYVLSLGGAVEVNDEHVAIKDVLPAEPFRLTGVKLHGNPKVNDEGLASFKNCKDLSALDLSATPVSDAGLQYFNQCKKLTYLVLNGTMAGDAGLKFFAGCTSLEVVELNDTKVSDQGLAALNDCKHLQRLSLSSTKVGDAGLACLKEFPELTCLALSKTAVTDQVFAAMKSCPKTSVLQLQGTQISDKGLVSLKEQKQLIYVLLKETRVTEAGVRDLGRALPQCKIEWEGGVLKPSGDADRQAAEYALSIGGLVGINGERRFVTELPKVPFRLTTVNLQGNAGVTSAGLQCFKDCENVTFLDLSHTPVGNAAMPHFERCRNLAYLALGNTEVTNQGLASFKNCKGLISINVSNINVSDRGLANFNDCANLYSLTLSGTNVSDEGLAYFKDCKKLIFLSLSNTPVSDRGLARFKDSRNLSHLDLVSTQVTDAGLGHLKDCKKLTTLTLRNTQISDAGLAILKDCKSLRILDLNNTKVTDVGIAHLKECPGLEILGLNGTTVSDVGLVSLKGFKNLTKLSLEGTQVSDKGLGVLNSFKHLTEITLVKTRVTRGGVADLFKSLPQCKIEWDGGVIEPKQ